MDKNKHMKNLNKTSLNAFKYSIITSMLIIQFYLLFNCKNFDAAMCVIVILLFTLWLNLNVEHKVRLTIEQVSLKGISPIDWVKYYRPEWSEEQCSYYLWNCTCFPMSHRVTLSQLHEALSTPNDLTDYNDL